MTLERRLADALHQTDGFEPSPDLFARVNRSITEDRVHRRRVRTWTAVAATSLIAIFLLLGSVVETRPSGGLAVPRWSLELVETLVMTALLLVMGPAIRRFGRDYVADVFFMNRETGSRFLTLLDMAYYLAGTGYILVTTDLSFGVTILLTTGAAETLQRVAILAALIGVAHAETLLALPVVGLLYSATARRVSRHRAGAGAPSISPTARQADRVATAIVFTVVLLGMGGILVFVGLLLGGV